MLDRKPARVYTQAELERDTPPMRETAEEGNTLTPTHGVEMEMDSTNNEEVVGETEEQLSEHITAQGSSDEIITEDLEQDTQQPDAHTEETKNENNQSAVEREIPKVGDFIIFTDWKHDVDPSPGDITMGRVMAVEEEGNVVTV